MAKILVFGSGGHAKVVIDIIERTDDYEIEAIVEPAQSSKTSFFDYPVISESSLSQFTDRYAIIAIGDNALRMNIVNRLISNKSTLEFVSVIHPSAQVGRDVSIRPGTVVMAGAVINPGTQIGYHCIINTRASIDHDCKLADYASVGPGATLGGAVSVGKSSSISLGANIIHGITIGNDSVVGSGAVVVEHVPDKVVAYGVPCKVIRSRQLGDPYL
jgi:sugar O-acyltransferase (sialic acid O-acetyltransferase NeuD family)